MTANQSLQRRAWLLALLSLAERAGIDPVPKSQLHTLIYLANCLAPLYNELSMDMRVIKHELGPFYPDAQWDVDRMVAQGLVRVSSIEFRKVDITWCMDAQYATTEVGKRLHHRAMTTPLLSRASAFLRELVGAFASMRPDAADQAFLFDAIYATPGVPEWAALVFEDVENNLSAMTASAFDQFLPKGQSLSPRERVELYVSYLKEKASLVGERTAGAGT